MDIESGLDQSSLSENLKAWMRELYEDTYETPSKTTKITTHGRESSKIDMSLFPLNKQQIDRSESGHLPHMALMQYNHSEPCQSNHGLFRGPPVKDDGKILDVGTGDGWWTVDVAERFPKTGLLGIDHDSAAMPDYYVPPNSMYMIDDMRYAGWNFKTPFDMIHMGGMSGSFTSQGFSHLYRQAYERWADPLPTFCGNLAPGGWFETVETSFSVSSQSRHLGEEDETISHKEEQQLADTELAKLGPRLVACAERAGRDLEPEKSMRSRIAAAGFEDIHEHNDKLPIGAWAKHPVYKGAGRLSLRSWSDGLEGWLMVLLTEYEDLPLTAKEVHEYAKRLMAEINSKNYHIYQKVKRIWARKPLAAEVVEEPEQAERVRVLTANGEALHGLFKPKL